MEILQEAVACYNRVLKHQQAVGFDPGLGGIWKGNFPDMGRLISTAKGAADLMDLVDQTHLFAVNFPAEEDVYVGKWPRMGDPVRIRERQIRWLLDRQKEDGLDLFTLPESIQESPFVHQRNVVRAGGRALTGNFLWGLSVAQRIFSRVDPRGVRRILELGAGCGFQARILELLHPGLHYTVVDLPETLILAYAFLRLSFPGKRILFVTSEAEARAAEDYDFALFPVVFSDSLEGGRHDLFINVSSLGEMTNATVRRWMDFVENRVAVKHLFSLNRFLNVVDERLASWRRDENACSVSYDSRWEILRWELEPAYRRCPYVDPICCRHLEVLASRAAIAPSPEELYRASEFLLRGVLDEDWYRLRGLYNKGLMLMLGGSLTTDLTMTGTLFRLWESIRLLPNLRNVATMIEYLGRLPQREGRFEELYHYQGLLRHMGG